MVSSTFSDLKEHRSTIIEWIVRLGYRAEIVDSSGVADVGLIRSSLNMVRDSAAYVGVISGKYRPAPFDQQQNPDRLSIAELELNEAMRLKRPILLFIMGEWSPRIGIGGVELDP